MARRLFGMVRPRVAAGIALFLQLLISPTVHGQVRFPLEGYYRPGRCMPVRIESSGTSLRLDTEGAVPTEVIAGEGKSGIVPMLVLASNAGALRAGTTELPLHALEPNERLVGSTLADNQATMQVSSQLFPGQRIVAVGLDPASPIQGASQAWESLDALVLDGKIDPQRIPGLLSAGTTLVVKSKDRPDDRWPWQQVGEYWILRYDPAGPRGAIGGSDAYLPTQAWQPGHLPAFRRQVVLAGVLVALLAMSTLLTSGRWWIPVLLIVIVGCCAGIEIWRRRQSPVYFAGGDIIVNSGGVQQIDHWRFAASTASSPTVLVRPDRPEVFDPAHASRIGLTIQCAPDGQPQWRFTLPTGSRLAFLWREMEVNKSDSVPAVDGTDVSPLLELARQGYLAPGLEIKGESSSRSGAEAESAWPSVIIGERARR